MSHVYNVYTNNYPLSRYQFNLIISIVYMMFVYRTTVWSSFLFYLYFAYIIYLVLFPSIVFCACLFIINHASVSFTGYDGMIMCMEPEPHSYEDKEGGSSYFSLSVTSCVIHSTHLWSSLCTTKPLTGREGMATEG